MAMSKNRYLADIGTAVDSAVAGNYLTVDDSGGVFNQVDWSNITNTPNVLDSADVINVIDSAHVNARVDLSSYATTTYVDNQITSVIDGAPGALDTLNELAAAINDDASFAATVTQQITELPDSAQVSTIITSTVDQTFVNNLNVNADTLDGQQGTYYTNYTNLTNTPNVLDSAQIVSLVANAGNVTQSYVDAAVAALPDSAQVSGIITADVDKTFVDNLNVDADTLDGQDGTYYLNYNNFTNTPNVLDSVNVNALVDAGITNLVDGAPASLDTLNELAAALNDDANLASTLTAQIAALPDSAQVSSIITSDVDKTFVDNLNIDADTLDGQQGTYYLNYNNFTNQPSILDSGNVTNIVDSAYVRARGWDSANTTSLVDSAYVYARGWDSANTTSLIDSNYVDARATSNAGFGLFNFVATADQTAFTGADADSATLAYTADNIMAFYNGVLLLPTLDYTATDGTTFTLTEGADSGANITIVKFGAGAAGSVSGVSSGPTLFTAAGMGNVYQNLGSNSGSSLPGGSLEWGYASRSDFYDSAGAGGWFFDWWEHPQGVATPQPDYTGLALALPNGDNSPGAYQGTEGDLTYAANLPGIFLVIEDVDFYVSGVQQTQVPGPLYIRSSRSSDYSGGTQGGGENHVFLSFQAQYPVHGGSADWADFGDLSAIKNQLQDGPGLVTRIDFTIRDTSSDTTDYNGLYYGNGTDPLWNNIGDRFSIIRGARNTSEDFTRRNSGTATGEIDGYGISVENLGPAT